jgi:hypothetical protein
LSHEFDAETSIYESTAPERLKIAIILDLMANCALPFVVPLFYSLKVRRGGSGWNLD